MSRFRSVEDGSTCDGGGWIAVSRFRSVVVGLGGLDRELWWWLVATGEERWLFDLCSRLSSCHGFLIRYMQILKLQRRVYTGDSYTGEWCNRQSHGVGVQTCNDGSYYIGEFKYGVKHGLGCYHFRETFRWWN